MCAYVCIEEEYRNVSLNYRWIVVELCSLHVPHAIYTYFERTGEVFSCKGNSSHTSHRETGSFSTFSSCSCMSEAL